MTEEVEFSGKLLHTFTNISGSLFPRAMQTALDMSMAMGTAPKNAAVSVGRALNDPTTGLVVLQRMGFIFARQQVDRIKAMATAGNLSGAQGLILDELNGQLAFPSDIEGDNPC